MALHTVRHWSVSSAWLPLPLLLWPPLLLGASPASSGMTPSLTTKWTTSMARRICRNTVSRFSRAVSQSGWRRHACYKTNKKMLLINLINPIKREFMNDPGRKPHGIQCNVKLFLELISIMVSILRALTWMWTIWTQNWHFAWMMTRF